MVVVLIVLAVSVPLVTLIAGLVRDDNYRRKDGLTERTPAVKASEKRTAGHVWLFVAVLVAMLLVGTIRNADQMPQIIAVCIALLEIALVALCGSQAFSAYRASFKVDR